MDTDQRNARIFGVLFIITFLTSIPASLLFQSVLDDPAGYIAGSGNTNQIYLAVLWSFFSSSRTSERPSSSTRLLGGRARFSQSATSPLESSNASSLPPESSLCSG